MHELQERYYEEIEDMVDICHLLAEDKAVASQGGNLACAADRLEDPSMAQTNIIITPSQLYKADIEFDDICIVSHDGKTLYAAEGRRPTSEHHFHRLILNSRPDLVSTIHAHPSNTTAFAMMPDDTPNYMGWPLLPETVIEVGPACRVPYAQPSSEKIAEEFKPYLNAYNTFLMNKHGVTIGSTEGIKRTWERLDLLEVTAEAALKVLASGEMLTPLTEADVRDMEEIGRNRGMKWPGAPGHWGGLVACYEKAFGEIAKYYQMMEARR